MKKIFTLMTLLVAMGTGAWGTATPTEIIKITLTGQSTNSVTGLIGGTGSQSGMNKGTPYKFNGDGAYVAIKLNQGHFQPGDIVKIDGNKAMQLYTGEPTTGTLLATTAAPTSGVITYTLPASLPAGTSSIYIYRASSTYNGTLTYMSVTRNIYDNQPNIYAHPLSADYSKDAGATALSVVAAASTGELSYQWKSCTDSDKNGSVNIEGKTTSSYTPSTASTGTFYFYCTVTDGNGSVDTDVATITVTGATAPGISIDNYSPSTPRGMAVTFTATPTGSPSPTVTWYQSETATNSGGTSKGTGVTYSPDVTTVGTYYYYAVASNGVSPDATSDLITLTVTNPDVDRSGYNTYYIAKDEQPVPDEQILCDDITMTFVNGKAGETFTKGVDDTYVSDVNAKFVASISASNGNNGWKAKFVPTVDGSLSVGVVINNNKTFSITPAANVTSFTYVGKNNAATPEDVCASVAGSSFTTGSATTDKLYVVVSLAVEKDKEYSFSVAGSKMGFYGFEFTPDAVPVTIGATEWATYCNSAKALDFDGSDVKAYIVTGATGSAIEKDAVTKVEANTPLLLNAAKGVYAIPVAASGTSYTATNKLKAGEGTAVASGDNSGYNYVLVDNSGAAVFQKIEGTSATVAVGKAYLALTENPAGARTLGIDDGGTTGIENIKVGTDENVYYDLQGHRVLYPTKGLYIVNGKKVILK